MRILLITTGLLTGGAERQVVDLATAWDAAGHAVHIISLTGTASQFPIPEGVDVTFLGLRKQPLAVLRGLRAARAVVRQWKPDVLHSHMFHANVFARLLRLTSPGASTVPLFCTVHSTQEGGWLRMLAYRLTDPACTLTTHVSADGRTSLIKTDAAPAERVVVIPNGIDTARFAPDPASRVRLRTALGIAETTRLLLHVGRLVPEKAQHTLVEAFAQVHAAHPATHLLIAGNGPLRTALAQQIAAAGLDGAVTLLGNRDDIPALLQAADLFVLSSNIEGMPLAVAEALASELPVVATDVSGIRLLVRDAQRIVPPGDAAALAAAIRATLDAPRSPEARAAMVETFGISAIAESWLTLYEQCGAYDASRDDACNGD
ncbi:glycosyltransferase [Imbroritus primus]|uniref:Glycosyltransferase n=1 Tax=Imbroritus primus TaxID=3058603 RepID=A0ACD3SRZ1_9BURK|nr:glycosyltransferase [Burkholderiaceae bacterium PBA]